MHGMHACFDVQHLRWTESDYFESGIIVCVFKKIILNEVELMAKHADAPTTHTSITIM